MDTFQALVAREDGDRIVAAVADTGRHHGRRSSSVNDVIGVLDELRAGAFSGRAVVRVAGGF